MIKQQTSRAVPAGSIKRDTRASFTGLQSEGARRYNQG